MKNNIIELNKISVIFNKDTANEVTALKNLTLNIEQGDVIIIEGGNGSGKSTLLNLIKKNVIAAKGNIKIHGIDISKLSNYRISKKTSTIFQNPSDGLCLNLTVYENLIFGLFKNTNLKLKWTNSKSYRKKIIDHLETLNIRVLIEKIDERLANLSGGQRQLVSIAKVSLELPELLLLDEPVSALDSVNSLQVENLILETLEKNKTTALWVTHKKIDSEKTNFKYIKLLKGEIQ